MTKLLHSACVRQDILMEREDELEETLAGLATQLADAEDTWVVEDLQSKDPGVVCLYGKHAGSFGYPYDMPRFGHFF